VNGSTNQRNAQLLARVSRERSADVANEDEKHSTPAVDRPCVDYG
jgi:hypothetical protein